MSAIPEEYIGVILRKIAAQYKLRNWGYYIAKFESIAQNYFGIIVPVVLSGRHERKQVKIQLVLKLAPNDERYRVSGAVTVMFAREIYVYTVILKKYKELQKRFPLHLQYTIPKGYYFHKEYCKEVIAMQDMCGVGYKPYTHEIFLDLDHIIISLKLLAQLHGLSFILRHKHPGLYEKVSKVCVPLTEHSNGRYMDIMRDRLDKALMKFHSTEYTPLLQKLKQNCGKFFDSASNSVQGTCICHGDIWKENILYKYKDNKLTTACMIDYQTARICSPAYDTMYLIISSTSTEIRHKHLPQLLDLYYQMFELVLNEAGLESQELYSRQMLANDLRTVSPACLIMANTAMWLSNGLQEEGHVKSKHVWKTLEERHAAVKKYKEIMKAIIDDLTSYGYLSFDLMV